MTTKANQTKRRTKSKNAGTSRREKASNILQSLPESIEHIEAVQRIAAVLEEMQVRVADVKEEANKELQKLMKRYEGKYKALEKKVHQVTEDAKKQAQVSMIHLLQKWHEHKEKLPAPLSREIEKIIAHIGAKAMSRKTRPIAKPKKTTKAAVKKPAKTTKSAKEGKSSSSI